MDTGTSAVGSITCGHCGMIHQGQCPRIKAIEYYPDGISIKRVEYHESKPIVGIDLNPMFGPAR